MVLVRRGSDTYVDVASGRFRWLAYSVHAANSDMNSRRNFLIQAPVALLGAVAACRVEERQAGAGGTTTPHTDTGCAAGVQHGPAGRARSLARHLRRSREVGAGAA